MFRKLPGRWLCLIVIPILAAQPVPEAAAQLAASISSLMHPRSIVSFEFQNLSSLPASESSAFRSALERELKKTGIETGGPGQADAQVRVSISQNVQGFLLVGEVRSGDRRETVLQPWIAPAAEAPPPRLKLKTNPIWEQPDPILDFALMNAGSELLVLSVGRLSLYQGSEGQWKLSGSANLSLSRPMPRDPRGRLVVEQGAFRAYFPGTSCLGTAEPLVAACSAGNESWPVNAAHRFQAHWVSDRNFLESPGVQGAFYTAAPLESGRVITTAMDGQQAWGNDIASAPERCGSNSIVIATRPGDDHAPDALQAYEVSNEGAAPVSQPMPLPGPVVALWRSEDPNQISVVARNLKTGNYEASRLDLACAE